MDSPIAGGWHQFVVAAVTLATSACSSRSSWSDAPPPSRPAPAACTHGQEGTGTLPPPSIGRYEPTERLDRCNVTTFSGTPTLALPPPPKSGFRVVLPPRRLDAGEEAGECVALPYPEFQHKNVYAARLYTNGYLHHSNVAGLPYAPGAATPYPGCNPGQDDPDSFMQTLNLLYGKISDVLFTNSTQVQGGEDMAFPDGMAYRVTTEAREIVAQVHWLNASRNEVTSEIVYDFFTMPDEQVENELVPFAFENRNIDVPARTTADVTTTCAVNSGGKIASLLPHAHKRTTNFAIDLLAGESAHQRIFENGAFDGESDITVFENPIDLAGYSRLRFTCTVDNDLERPITWGLGDDEMCMIFGYMYPARTQQLAVVYPGESACTVVDVGSYRK